MELTLDQLRERLQDAPPEIQQKAMGLVPLAFPEWQNMRWSRQRRTGLWRQPPADGVAWAQAHFPAYFQDTSGKPVPLAQRHEEFWEYIWALRPGIYVPAFLAIWGRGGAKSTTMEIGCAAIGYFGLRKYGWYISGTQEQADAHVENIATLFEKLGVDRSLSRYGQSRGWRTNLLRTADGFTLEAVGLDSAARGVKRDEDRFDLCAFDDLDNESDSLAVIDRKERALTMKLLPAGTNDAAVIGLQNLPNEDGIFARLVNGKADYLKDRVISGPHPALEGFEDDEQGNPAYRQLPTKGGGTTYVILRGTPTWAGQDKQACTALLNRIGPRAFLIECQHKTELLSDTLFKRERWKFFYTWPEPDWFDTLIQSWDFRTSETEQRNEAKRQHSYVAGHLWGRKGSPQDGQVYLLDRYFAQVGFIESCEAIKKMSEKWPGAYVKLIEAAANGPAVFASVRSEVFGVQLMPVGGKFGSKYARAAAVSLIQGQGRAWLPAPELSPWVHEYIEHMYNFPKYPNDDGDATSQAWHHACPPEPTKDLERERQAQMRELFAKRKRAVQRSKRRVSRTGA